MVLTRNIKYKLFQYFRQQSKATVNYDRKFFRGSVQLQAEEKSYTKVDFDRSVQRGEFVFETFYIVKKDFTDADLDAIEKNIVLRKQHNNVPLLRTLLAKLRRSDEKNVFNIRKQVRKELKMLPNATHERLCTFGDKPLELMRFAAEQPKQKQSAEAENSKEFSEICKRFNMFRMDHLGNYTGHKSYYLLGALAVLEQALVRNAMAALKKNYFRLISVPDILPSNVIEGCGMRTEGDRTQVYKLDSGQCLSGTSEMALAGYFAGEVFEEKDLPIKVAAVSRCFRAETSGLHEEKGIYRVHQFTKVEMFAICSKEQSEKMLGLFKDIEVSIFQKLGLNFRLLDMPPSELGAPAYEKYDIEAWMPGRKMWGEISSCSNCTDYQAKRLKIQYRTKDNQLKFVHTVNGTAAAIPRLLISIIESNQDGNDSILIPTSIGRHIKIKEIKKDKYIPEIKLVKFIKPSK